VEGAETAMNGQRLSRKAWSEGSPEQEMRRNEQKPDMRHGFLGETASPVKALSSNGSPVHPVRVHRSAIPLSREIPDSSGKSAEAVVPLDAGRAEHRGMGSR
jgi:hypothetical protein